jgi:hypothetical protein
MSEHQASGYPPPSTTPMQPLTQPYTQNYPPPTGPPRESPESPRSHRHAPPSRQGPAVGTGPIQQSLLTRAKADDKEALATMFGQFLPRGEQVLESHYLGVMGFWGIGTHSFGAVTERRIASLQISFLGGVRYQDGSLEHVNSAAVYQPSQAGLYIFTAAVSFFALLLGSALGARVAIIFLLISLLFLPLTVRLYYRFNKSGIVLLVREGLEVWAFVDRKRMRLSNQLYRLTTDLREERLRAVGHP